MSSRPSADRSAIFLREGAGDALQFSPSERLIWKAVGSATDGGIDQFELIADPDQPGAPEHIHDAVDESFFVVEGAFEFKVRDAILRAETGTYVLVPRGVRHTWRNAALRRSRMILTYAPGGMRQLFEEIAPLMHAPALDVAAAEAIMARYDSRIVGPPLPTQSPPEVR